MEVERGGEILRKMVVERELERGIKSLSVKTGKVSLLKLEISLSIDSIE